MSLATSFVKLIGPCFTHRRQRRWQIQRLKCPAMIAIESIEDRVLLSVSIDSVNTINLNQVLVDTISRPDPSVAPNIRFTLPIAGDSPDHRYFDRNPANGSVLAWNGVTTDNQPDSAYDGHRGTDFSGLPRNTPVYAAAGGTLMEKFDGLPDGSLNETTNPNGNFVRINHGNDLTGMPIISVYLHLNAGSVTPKPEGAWIEAGEQIGGIGTSGQSSGLHLHFGTQRGMSPNRVAFDPYSAFGETSWWSTALVLGSEFQVNSTTDGGPVGFFHGGLYPTSGSQFAVQVDSDADGNFVAVWQGPNRDGRGTFDIFLQRFDAKGRKVGAEVVVNADWHGEQTNPDVAIAPDGRIIVVYEHTEDDQVGGQFDSLTSISAQLLNPNGTPIGDPIQVASTPVRRWAPGVGVARDGSFVVTWTNQSAAGSSAAMLARRFDSSGRALSDEFRVNTTPLNSQVLQVSNSMATNDVGEFVVVWSNFGPDGTTSRWIMTAGTSSPGTALGSTMPTTAPISTFTFGSSRRTERRSETKFV